MNKQSMDLFMEACGVTEPLQLVIQNPGKQEATRRLFFQPYVLLGRDARCDWALDDDQVSRRHAYLQVIGGRAHVIDLGSRVGIYWGDQRRPSGWLDRTSPIRIGGNSLWLLAGDQLRDPDAVEVWNPLTQISAETAGLPDITLEFLNATGNRTTWRMNRALVLLGRGPDCKVQLMSSSVSRLHCSLVRSPMGLWVVDLHGRGGILANGAPVRCAFLEDGDRLQVGKMVICIRYHPSGPADQEQAATAEPGKTVPLQSTETTEQGPGKDLIPLTQLPSSELVVASSPLPALPGLTSNELVATLTPSIHTSFLSAKDTASTDASLGIVLTPIMHQFAAMQQQMFDQFQQTIMMMVQMFSTLHRDQVGLIRDELSRLQQLTQELNELQGELSRKGNPADPGLQMIAQSQAAPQTRTPDLETITRLKAMLEANAPAEGTAVAPGPVPKPAVRDAGRKGTAPRGRETTSPPRPVREPSQPALQPAAASQKPASPEKLAADSLGREVPKVQDDRDIHAWLCQRIATIQEERQGRWQKIASFILGRRAEGVTP